MRKFLKKLITKKEKEAEAIRAKIKASESAQEVRELGDTLQAVLDELQEAKDKLAEMDDSGDSNSDPAQVSNADDNGDNRSNFDPAQARSVNRFDMNQRGENRTGNALDSMEYRQAFMNYVQTGEWNYQKRAEEQGRDAEAQTDAHRYQSIYVASVMGFYVIPVAVGSIIAAVSMFS